MFLILRFITQNWPWAVAVLYELSGWVIAVSPQEKDVTVKANLPSRASWFRPGVVGAVDEELELVLLLVDAAAGWLLVLLSPMAPMIPMMIKAARTPVMILWRLNQLGLVVLSDMGASPVVRAAPNMQSWTAVVLVAVYTPQRGFYAR